MTQPGYIEPLSVKDVVSSDALTRDDVVRVLDTAHRVKRDVGAYSEALRGRAVVLLFEKASLRTRLTFEIGGTRLGGQVIYYDHSAERIGSRESAKDYAKNLERWVHGIVARTYSQQTIELLAEHARVPVINALSDAQHPCQALADVMTLEERFGKVTGLRVVYIGDGNNVCVSLAQTVAHLGAHMIVITPKGFEPDAGAMAKAREFAIASGGSVTHSHDTKAVTDADALYTDTWVSMHQKDDADRREEAFVPYRVDAALMAKAKPRAVFMHCLPAHRGEEVTDDVMDSAQSVVFEQAENRLHAQNAVLLHTVAARTASVLDRPDTGSQQAIRLAGKPERPTTKDGRKAMG